jgi:hypothetical protein
MMWLSGKFGLARLRSVPVVLPTPEFFPEELFGDELDPQAVFHHVCELMGANAEEMTIEVVADEQLPTAAGHYDQAAGHVIRIPQSEFDRPLSLTSILAHEISHHLLLASGKLTGEEDDHEWVTDLLPVFLGFGVITANSAIEERHYHYQNYEGWSYRRIGYLPVHLIGYALALFAYARGEERPAWSARLRPDARDVLKKGLRYLRSGGDTLFDANEVGRERQLSVGECQGQLKHASAARRVVALWRLAELGESAGAASDAIVVALGDANEDVRTAAAQAIAALAPGVRFAATEALASCLRDPHDEVRIAAAEAAGALATDAAALIPELCILLDATATRQLRAAACALSNFGEQAARAREPLMAALARKLVECDHETVEGLVAALHAVDGEAASTVRNYFKHHAPGLLGTALAAMHGQRRVD